LWEKYLGAATRDAAPAKGLRQLAAALEKLPEPATPAIVASGGQITFELQGRPYVTAGITKEQLLATFDLAPKVDKKAGEGASKKVLAEFGGALSRTVLTEEQGERYLVRLREILES
jgi:hypothetical protein